MVETGPLAMTTPRQDSSPVWALSLLPGTQDTLFTQGMKLIAEAHGRTLNETTYLSYLPAVREFTHSEFLAAVEALLLHPSWPNPGELRQACAKARLDSLVRARAPFPDRALTERDVLLRELGVTAGDDRIWLALVREWGLPEAFRRSVLVARRTVTNARALLILDDAEAAAWWRKPRQIKRRAALDRRVAQRYGRPSIDGAIIWPNALSGPPCWDEQGREKG